MTSETEIPTEASPIVACTICRDVQNFDLLIEDMETALGDGWGDLGFGEAVPFFTQADAKALEFVALAADCDDEDNLDQLELIIKAALTKGIKVILIADDMTPASLHRLLRAGANEFVPYPLPEGELEEAIAKIRAPEPATPVELVEEAPEADRKPVKKRLQRDGSADGVLIAVHGLAGGVGATTMAVNLAWELANQGKTEHPRVCLLDLDLQFGSLSTYLDLSRREAVYELISDIESMDEDSFAGALLSFEDKLQVLTAPPDILPMDMIGPSEVQAILEMARQHFDYVIVDMPKTLVQWSETVLTAAHVYFALIELDMRSAQNSLRLKRALQCEDLPFEKLRFVLNRGPRFTDLNGKSRVKRLAESLGISIDLQLPDGGRPVLQACDHGHPLAVGAAKNPLRKEFAKLAASLHALGDTESEAA